MVGGLALYGGFNGTELTRAQRDPAANTTILSGDLNQDDDGNFGNITDNAVTVIYAFSETNLCTLDGITITGGASLDHNRCAITTPGTKLGGGIIALFSDIEINNCTITENAAVVGGGIYLPNITSWRITNTDIINNRAISEPVSAFAAGAFLSGSQAPAELTNTRFLGNISDGITSGLFLIGGAPSVNNCLFSGNRTIFGSDTIFLRLVTGAVLNNLTVINNQSDANWVTAGINMDTTVNVSISNSLLWGNITQAVPGPPKLTQKTNIQAVGTFSLDNNTIQGWDGTLGGTNNNGLDPLFIDALGPDGIAGTIDDNPRLADLSPAIDSGNSTLVPASTTTDLDDNPRITGSAVDRGAYEVQPLGCSPADITTTNTNPGDPGYGIPDGTTNGADLSFFVEAWLAGSTTIADITTTNTNPGDPNYGIPDSFVNGADLSFYVELWLVGCP